MGRHGWKIGACAIALTLQGCPNYELAPLEPCTVSGVGIDVPQVVTQLDVLFVVDDSGSMRQEQTALANELPRMVRVLASGDLDGDGQTDFPAVDDMHLGVVSTDLGAAGQDPDDLLKCALPGRDGQLVYPDQCAGTREGNYLAFSTGDDPDALGDAFACVTQLGIDGCGLEQQLDAMLKALTPASSPTTFYAGSAGHGGALGAGTPNAGFLRDGAVLAVILVTDEDDCSIPDENAALMTPADAGPYSDHPLNLRCGFYPEALHPVSRYRDGLLALKPLNPELVIFAAITGIPTRLEGADPQTILADPEMQYRSTVPQSSPNYKGSAEPEPSCTFPNPAYDPTDPQSKPNQEAYPPRRIVETAALFGENGVVRSLCQESFTGALDAVIRKISDRLPEPCLPQPLIRSEEGLVECDVVELIPDDGTGAALCDESRGRSWLESRPVTDPQTGASRAMQVCAIDQVPVRNQTLQPNGSGQVLGWYYDDYSTQTLDQCAGQPQQIRFTEGADPTGGVVVSLECVRPVFGARDDSRGKDAVGLGCEGDSARCSAHDCTPAEVSEASRDCDKPYALACEPQSNTCQIGCVNDVDCPDGWRCHGDPTQGGLCVLPTCSTLTTEASETMLPGL